MDFGTEFFERLERARAPLLTASRRLVGHRLFPLAAPEWTVNQLHVIRATVPTLDFVLCQCASRVEDDFAHSAMWDYLEAKRFDEKGHDVLLLQDLERIGKRAAAEAAPTDPDVAAMVGSQFYLAQFEHPVAYLGFIATLEAFAPTVEEIEGWGRGAGIPREALSCALLHAQTDLGHREDLRTILDLVPEHLRALVGRNALQCVEYQRQAILTLCRRLEAFEKNLQSRAVLCESQTDATPEPTWTATTP